MIRSVILGLAGVATTIASVPVWVDNPNVFELELFNNALQFDFYVFAHSWQPSFCYHEPYPAQALLGCKEPQEYWKTHFTVHGLWPELNEGPHPGFCSKEELNIDLVRKAIGEVTLEEYWPNVKVPVNSSSYDSFWNHEWTRHGTCSGLDQVTYFKSAIELIKTHGTPECIQKSVGKTMSTKELREAYGGPKRVVLQCKGKTLSQVFTCIAKDKNNVPTKASDCSIQVLKEDTCHGTEVYLPAF
ncbi:hypothetical protein THRCLA_02301 [Thraustotheca clavata]|uniref:Secreted protein n=1 Tax=Thraustotheca clavata TaxID=74557 RepID=A0A0A7CLB7_9STRA|nr:secreted protein [Thraustotheca clavata]OQS05596.1 hypothetical protein THRCLA_02301 [Thraustotheca clavata]